jgi:hypothetical protein
VRLVAQVTERGLLVLYREEADVNARDAQIRGLTRTPVMVIMPPGSSPGPSCWITCANIALEQAVHLVLSEAVTRGREDRWVVEGPDPARPVH